MLSAQKPEVSSQSAASDGKRPGDMSDGLQLEACEMLS
jgi:hypothetical protein